jgi:DNA-binding NtrC family response regulator
MHPDPPPEQGGRRVRNVQGELCHRRPRQASARRARSKEAREEAEREVVQDALRRHRGKITAAALELGVSRPTLYELMEKLGIAKGE